MWLRKSKVCIRGFTLIEIMVATVIMVILVGFFIKITTDVLKVWNRSAGKLSRSAEARIAMDMIASDIENSLYRNNGQQWLRIQGPEVAGGEFNGNSVSLKLFSAATDRPQKFADSDFKPVGAVAGDPIPGELCAVGYHLKFKESYAGGTPTYSLYRHLINPYETFLNYIDTAELDLSVQATLSGIDPSPDGWSEVSITQNKNYLVGNIVEFKLLVYLQGQTDPINADANSFELKYMTYSYGGMDASLQNGQQKAIDYMVISLKVISDEGMRELQNIDNLAFSGSRTDFVNDVILKYVETYTRRVHFTQSSMF
jgi:prepilin-type N-terminal cleavage/methylation domain-containing protein